MKKHAVMLYLIKDNSICFLVRNKQNDTVHKQGALLSIGGKVEEGESLDITVKREAKEEADITVNSAELRAILYFRNFGTEKHDWVDYLYTSNDFTGEPTAGNEGSFIWENIQDIDKLNLYKQDKLYLGMLQKHSFFAIEFLCEGHEMVDYSILKAL